MNKFVIGLVGVFLFGCTAAEMERDQQEALSKEAIRTVGMPGIKNFREKKLLKEILEMRDQASLTTYTYIVAEQTGQMIFFCNSIGYGIPYATQYTDPSRPDPNGLYSPSSADGTWIMCKDPNGNEVKPVYVEPKIIVSQFKLQ